MSATYSTDDQPRPSTSKDGVAEPRVSLATMTDPREPIHPAELRRRVAGPQAPQQRNGPDTSKALASASNLAKLQTYLPTGSWVAYTTLETWAFSLRPDDPSTSPSSNCNAHQRIAVVIVIFLSAAFAFLSSFLKRFVYDAQGTHVLYPPPDLFSVAHRVSDPVTRVQFPCRTREHRYCWPLVDGAGELVYDEKGERLRVVVFKLGVRVHVRRRVWAIRVWRACFEPEEDVPDAPRLSTSLHSKHLSLASTLTKSDARGTTVEIDGIITTVPALQPRWTHTILGAAGGKAYLDFRPRVWGHALVSVLGFLALALFSTQVRGCLYPTIPDYLPSTLQTGMLFALSFVAAVFVQDDAISIGQLASWRHVRTAGDEEVPQHLRGVVEMLVWVGRQDFGER